ncbi:MULTISPECIES: hypothetical protein [unclassified Nocardioides]|jgi:hypothetical protein|uniref:hypothetical protein n=1 Tax=unclassified Nocardioides TaxID=2615069 RepID=UPI000703B276|nr:MULTISPECIES: hypothetical protein [unclassified Nocardioides]KRC54958.1 hypothetical protein ASE19_05780 [Nocardioides sp. Root79]KRC73693.1 hypothetical protein ASE20_03435 [Nocardioides sp. Root240]
MTSFTPLPGDPHAVATEGHQMTSAAARMLAAAKTLNRIADTSDFQSDAIDGLRKNAGEMADVMVDAWYRYQFAGKALTEYAPKLEAAQKQADRAIAQHGSTDVWSARGHVARLEAEKFNPLLGADERAELDAQISRAHSDLSHQESVAGQAEALYNDAVADRDRAAVAAMNQIESANKVSGLNDSFWDNFKGFREKYLDAIVEAVIDVLDAVADVLLLIAPFTGPLMPYVFAAGAILKAATLVWMTFQVLTGQKTIGQFLERYIKVVGGLVLTAAKLLDPKSKFGVAKDVFGLVVKHGEPILENHGGPKLTLDYYEYFLDRDAYVEKYGADGVAAQSAFTGGMTILDPAGGALDMGAGMAGAYFDNEILDPSTVWTTDDLATHDVSGPVGTDYSNVDPESIVGNAFGHPASGSPHASRHVVAAGSGGGGW